MTITLTPEQKAWIDAHVARGDYASAEEAVRTLVDAAIADVGSIEHDDLAWAKPLVDEALSASERGEVMTLEEHRARNSARLAAMKE